MREYIPTYSTTDLYPAAYLKAIGMQLVGVSKSGGSRVTFEFEDAPACKAHILAFLNEADDEIQASVYADSIKKLKALAMRGEL